MPTCPVKVVFPHVPHTPVIVHVPHAATSIPETVRRTFLLDDAAIERELVRVTDWHVDHLFAWALDYGATLMVNTHSRLVFDPERFREDDPAEDVGQGVVYTRTADGRPLAHVTPEERAERIENLYDPYHEMLTVLVERELERFGMAFILDCHSFPTVPVPTETDTRSVRPDLCIGTDAFHTPPRLVEGLERAAEAEGLVVHQDSPFAGTLVPMEYYHKDRRVRSVMIEVRRGLYCNEETGERTDGLGEMRATLERVVGQAVGMAVQGR